MSKEKIITTITFIFLIAAFIAGIYFIVRLVNGPGDKKEQSPFDYTQGKKTYTHPDYGFTFDYPASFTLGRFPEGEGEMILVQGSNGEKGFQIFISPYEEKEELSLAVIKKSAGESTVKDGKEIQIGQESLKAFSFTLSGAEAEPTQEIWLTQEGDLYQFSSFEEFGKTMEKFLETLRFN